MKSLLAGLDIGCCSITEFSYFLIKRLAILWFIDDFPVYVRTSFFIDFFETVLSLLAPSCAV